MLGISQGAVSDLLSGKFAPSYEVMQRLVELGYNPLTMLSGKGPLRLDGEPSQIPVQLASVAGVLYKYPELLGTVRDAIETREKLEAAQNQLKAELHYPKGKKKK